MLDHADASTLEQPPNGPSAGPQIAGTPIRRIERR